MAGLNIAPKLNLPPEAVTQTLGILGKRGVGKTHTASVLAEEMLTLGAQIIVLDPLDVWWGLRADVMGAPSGFPIVVIGGSHGDLPLSGDSGELLADFAVEQGASMVLSLRHLSKNDQRRFVTAFCERLYHRKGEPEHRGAVHVFVDEADAFAPQRVPAGQERMLGAIDDLVRRGRSSGVGVTLITQRSAAINKDVLTQIEVLVCHRTVSPQDRKALDAWVEAHDAHDQRATFMASLAGLAIGEAWFWSPGWLDIFQRVQVRARTTFDSSATPKQGAKQVTVALRKVDIDALKGKLAATIGRAKEDDPKALRKQIAELTRQINAKPTNGKVDSGALIAMREELRLAKQIAAQSGKELSSVRILIQREGKQLVALGTRLLDQVGQEQIAGFPTSRATKPEPRRAEPVRAPNTNPRDIPRDNDADITTPQQKILDAIAAFEPLGLNAISKSVAAVYAGVSPTSGGYFNNLGRLRAMGLIDYPTGGQVSLTDAGRARADTGTVIRSIGELHEAWCRMLPNPQSAILRAVIEIYPDDVAKDELAERVAVSPTSGGYFNNLGRLRTLGAIEYPMPGRVVATDLLFPAGVPA